MRLYKIFSFVSLLALITSCKSISIVEKTIYSFSTFFTIKAYETTDEQLYKIESTIQKYNKYFDAFNSYDNLINLCSINETNNKIQLDKDFFDALKLVDQMYKKTDGYFNPYMGELTFAYKNSYTEFKQTGILSLPTEDFVQEKLGNIKDFNLEFFDDELSVKRNGQALIDLGAFAKGYVLDVLKDKFLENDIRHYFINAGNSSSYFTTKPNGDPFKVGVKYLKKKALNVKNSSIGISSIFEQYAEYNGLIYSHIINPFTGLPETQYDFTIVQDEIGVVSDIFSTVLMILNDKTMIEKFSEEFDFEYAIFKDENPIFMSTNLVLENY